MSLGHHRALIALHLQDFTCDVARLEDAACRTQQFCDLDASPTAEATRQHNRSQHLSEWQYGFARLTVLQRLYSHRQLAQDAHDDTDEATFWKEFKDKFVYEHPRLRDTIEAVAYVLYEERGAESRGAFDDWMRAVDEVVCYVVDRAFTDDAERSQINVVSWGGS